MLFKLFRTVQDFLKRCEKNLLSNSKSFKCHSYLNNNNNNNCDLYIYCLVIKDRLMRSKVKFEKHLYLIHALRTAGNRNNLSSRTYEISRKTRITYYTQTKNTLDDQTLKFCSFKLMPSKFN